MSPPRDWCVRWWSNEDGYVLATAFLLPALVMMVGLSFDLGMALHTRRQVANIAMESARLGATFIDEDEFRWNSTLVITEEGRQAAADFAVRAGAANVVSSLGRAQFDTGNTVLERRSSNGGVPRRVGSRAFAEKAVYTETDYVEVTVTNPVRYVFLARLLPPSVAEATAQALAVDVLQGCQGEDACGR